MSAEPQQPWPVRGKTALVTGGGSGICFALTRLLHSQGCNVLIADLAVRPEAQELIDASASQPARVVFQKTDVSQWLDLEAAVAACRTHFGALDIVCPGAGIYEPAWSAFWEPPGTAHSKDAPDSNSYKSIDINITHPIRLSQLALAHFLSQKVDGRIVHISSVAAQYPSPIHPLYSTAKASVSAFVRALATLEPQYGIRVNAVAPGVVKTPMWTDPTSADKLRNVDQTKDTWVTPEQVAQVMLQLIQDPELVGGTIMEVGAGSTRKVALLNDPGPNRGTPGLSISNAKVTADELAAKLKQGDWGVVTK